MLRSSLRGVVLMFLLGVLALSGTFPAAQVQAQTAETCPGRFFPETGYCVSGAILDYWNQAGGLDVFGLPIGPEQEEFIGLITASSLQEPVFGQQLRVQRFERNRLEIQPDGAVTVGRMGSEVLAQQGRDWFQFPRSTPQPGCEFFDVEGGEGFNVCGDMLEGWNRFGGLELMGRPLSDARPEMLEDGNEYMVQWFERARFQITPGVGVQLGLLGQLDLCANVPTPVNARISPSNCVLTEVSFVIEATGFAPNDQVRPWAAVGDILITPEDFGFTLQADDNGVVREQFTDGFDAEIGDLVYFVFQGSNGHVAIIYLKVVNPAFTPEVTSAVHPCINLPPPANGFGAPVVSTSDLTFNGDLTTCATNDINALGIVADGFNAGEQVRYRITAPNGTVNESTAENHLVASADGVAARDGRLLPYPVSDQRNANQLGIYSFFFEGLQSGTIAVVPVMITNTPAATLRVTNRSGQAVCGISFSASTSITWGFDRLVNVLNDPLRIEEQDLGPGGSRDFSLPAGTYDIRLQNCSGETIRTDFGLVVREFYEYAFEG